MQSPAFARRSPRRVAPSRAVLVRAALAISASISGALAQTVVPPGFAATPTVQQTLVVPFVRDALALSPQTHLLNVGGELFRIRDSFDPNSPANRPVLSLGNDDVSFLCADGPWIYAGALNRGAIERLDLATFARTLRFAGPKNAFDAAPLPGDDLLLSANPSWPAPNSNSGVWLAGPGRVPREIFALQGPSGPLLIATNGDLIVGELGPIVPPPPGAARLLRVPAARVAWAIAGGTLTMADVTAIGAGWNGIYDCVEDDTGRLFVTDPVSSAVRHTTSGGLTPVGTLLDVGPGLFASRLRFVPGAVGPLRGYQPPQHSASLHVIAGDYTNVFELLRVAPRRPVATVAPASPLPPGPATLQVDGGPANGLVLWLASLPTHAPEAVVLWQNGVPLWLGVPPSSLVLAAGALDTNGSATSPFANPGGATLRIDVQAIAVAASLTDLGSSQVLPIQLLP